jgi:hypothetical protein
MKKKDTSGEIQITQDMAFQRLEWRIQRVGWFLMAAVVCAALLGLFGDGPLSSAVQTSGSLRIEYDRFLHNQAPSEYRIHFSTSQAEFQLGFNHSFLQNVKLERITPDPIRAEISELGVTLHFTTQTGAQGTVIIPFEPKSIGFLHTKIMAPAEPSLHFTHFVYP